HTHEQVPRTTRDPRLSKSELAFARIIAGLVIRPKRIINCVPSGELAGVMFRSKRVFHSVTRYRVAASPTRRIERKLPRVKTPPGSAQNGNEDSRKQNEQPPAAG